MNGDSVRVGVQVGQRLELGHPAAVDDVAAHGLARLVQQLDAHLAAQILQRGDCVTLVKLLGGVGREPDSHRRTCQPGDQISYYVVGRSRNVVVNECARLAAEWDPARPDENVEYYQSKVLEIWDRFRRFTEQEGLQPFSEDIKYNLNVLTGVSGQVQ